MRQTVTISLSLSLQTSLEAETVRANQAERSAAKLQREVADANDTMADQQGLLEKVCVFAFVFVFMFVCVREYVCV